MSAFISVVQAACAAKGPTAAYRSMDHRWAEALPSRRKFTLCFMRAAARYRRRWGKTAARPVMLGCALLRNS